MRRGPRGGVARSTAGAVTTISRGELARARRPSMSTSLLRIAAKTATHRRPPIRSRADATIAAMPAGLCAPSMRIGGSPSIQSMRARPAHARRSPAPHRAPRRWRIPVCPQRVADRRPRWRCWRPESRPAAALARRSGCPSNARLHLDTAHPRRSAGEGHVPPDDGERRADLGRHEPGSPRSAGSVAPVTARLPGLMIAAFSRAISGIVSPSRSW